MHKPRLCRAVFGLVIATAAPAYADDSVAGIYEVKFEEVANNCVHPVTHEPRGVNYQARGMVKIEIKSGQLQVDIERTPLMLGSPRKDTKVVAKSRLGHTPYEGMDGVFSVAGRVTADGLLGLTMIGEYQDKGKPLCTQSWTLSGLRAKSDTGATGGKRKP